MSGSSGTLIDLPPIGEALQGIESRILESLPTPPINPVLDFFQSHFQSALDLYRSLVNPPARLEHIPKPLTVIAKPFPEVKPIKTVTQIHSSSSSSVSISGKLPRPLESSGGSSSSFQAFKPSESFGSSIGFRTYGPPQVGRPGRLFASRTSTDDDDVKIRFPEEELNDVEK